jgi:integrase
LDIYPIYISKLLGHKNINTTMKYYAKAEQKKLAEEIKKFSARKNGTSNHP